MEQRPVRNAFGSLIVDPDELTQRQRIDVVRRLAGRWQASSDRETNWFGRKLTEWLHGPADGDLLAVLGLLPQQGSHATAPAVVAQERRDTVLLQLSTAAGGDRAALRLFTPAAKTDRWADLIAELGGRPPGSAAAFTRARQRVSQQVR